VIVKSVLRIAADTKGIGYELCKKNQKTIILEDFNIGPSTSGKKMMTLNGSAVNNRQPHC